MRLVALLDEDGDAARKIRQSIHRTQLWKYTSGKRRPDVDGAYQIEQLTDGRVLASDWGVYPDGRPVTERGTTAPADTDAA